MGTPDTVVAQERERRAKARRAAGRPSTQAAPKRKAKAKAKKAGPTLEKGTSAGAQLRKSRKKTAIKRLKTGRGRGRDLLAALFTEK